MRILRDPAADAAGGGTSVASTPTGVAATPPAAPANPTQTATVASPAPTPPPQVPLTVEEYQRLREIERKYADAETKQREALEAKEREKLKALADKEGIETALKRQEEEWRSKYATKDQEYSTLKGRLLGEKLANVVSASLDGVVFTSSDAAKDAREKLERLLQASEDASGAIVVRDKVTGRPAADVIREALSSPSFAHFLAPTSKGGTGSTGGNRSNATPSPANTPDAAAAEVARFKAALGRVTAGAPGLTGHYAGNINVGTSSN